MSKIVLFQAIQFSMSSQFSFISPIDKTLSGPSTQVQSGPESDDNKGVHRFHYSVSSTEALPLDCLASYLGHSLEES